MTISPAFLDELDRFEAGRKRRIRSRDRGDRETDQLGEGRTFADFRRYVPGDDTRRLDWKLYARTEELFVKQYEAEREATVHVLVDASGSMDFGAGEAHKFEFAAKLGLAAAYLTAEAHEDFRFSVFTDGYDRLDAGRSSRGEVLGLIDRCNRHTLGGTADFAAALEAYAGAIRSRAVVLVLSDLLDDPLSIETGLAALAKNEVTVARLVAPDERDPPPRGDTIFEDVESARRRRTYFGGRTAQTYRSRLEDHVDAVAERCESLGVRLEVVSTGADFFDAFGAVWRG